MSASGSRGVSAFGSRGCLPLGPGGVCLWVQGVCLWVQGDIYLREGYLPSGPKGEVVCVPHPLHHTPFHLTPFHNTPLSPHPAHCGQKNTHENITLLQTSFAGGKNKKHVCRLTNVDFHFQVVTLLSRKDHAKTHGHKIVSLFIIHKNSCLHT